MTDQAQILPGTLDVLILKAVSLGPLHGYGILLRIGQISGQALLIEQGALYPALFRLVRQGLLKASWGTSENNRRAKFYELTASGRKAPARGDGRLEPPGDRDRVRAGSSTGGSMKLLAYFRSMGEKFFRRSQLRRKWTKNSAATLRYARKIWNVPDWIGRKPAPCAHRVRRRGEGQRRMPPGARWQPD